ncbi:TetR/AcrR family transcriptional regulator [Flavisphingomonas formosensis]|uniref:TetR/AcrR family transcriptional regulator n=1 Tax=Flavisphingomonas formosensis TaxID=861534 RepID=UPI0012FC9310|nr:TetR/AcrR family transcriptional regulator [Sphingomonas formosensis]
MARRSASPIDPAPRSDGARMAAQRTVDRVLAPRYAIYLDEVNRFIAACVKVMTRTGDFSPRVKEVIDEAGLSNQAFYRHFASKEELLLAVIDAGTRDLDSYLRHRMASVDTPVERIRAWVNGFAAQAISPEAAAATRPFMIPSARLADRFPDAVRANGALLTASLEEALADAFAGGAVRGDIDPVEDARFIYDLAKEWLQRQLTAPQLPAPEEARTSARRLEAFVVAAIGGQ